jgi:hypothetical protein
MTFTGDSPLPDEIPFIGSRGSVVLLSIVARDRNKLKTLVNSWREESLNRTHTLGNAVHLISAASSSVSMDRNFSKHLFYAMSPLSRVDVPPCEIRLG